MARSPLKYSWQRVPKFEAGGRSPYTYLIMVDGEVFDRCDSRAEAQALVKACRVAAEQQEGR